ncbi:hypothetical protein [Magnetovibrio sp.]|uniref:hypothetical protein n=1 Tax=Magnetovibrio sp. TaxID=2024836 RepID=UPI002F94D24F
MYTRHDEVPVLSQWPDQVEAVHYNIALRALKRTPPSIRLLLPGLKTLDLILQNEAWIIVDRAFHDLPVAAWVDFQPEENRGLHEPVPCTLRYYHGHAGMILNTVLGLMDTLLKNQLDDEDETHQVLYFPKSKNRQ